MSGAAEITTVFAVIASHGTCSTSAAADVLHAAAKRLGVEIVEDELRVAGWVFRVAEPRLVPNAFDPAKIDGRARISPAEHGIEALYFLAVLKQMFEEHDVDVDIMIERSLKDEEVSLDLKRERSLFEAFGTTLEDERERLEALGLLEPQFDFTTLGKDQPSLNGWF
jgi:hypothetical protein